MELRLTRGGCLVCLYIVVFAACSCDPFTSSDPAPPHFHAIRTIRKLQEAESKYRSRNGRYADLAELSPEQTRSSDLFSTIARGPYHNYTFNVHAERSHYEVTAMPTPEAIRADEKTSYYGDESGLIRYSYDPASPADRNSLVLK